MNMNPAFSDVRSNGRSMKRRYIALVVAMLLVGSACAGSSDPSSDASSNTVEGSVQDRAASPSSDISDSGADAVDVGSDSEASAEGDSFDRDSFTLCPVIEAHKTELAAIVGLAVDPERGVETSNNECNIRGSEPGDFARVQLAAKFVPSFEFYLDGYEGSLTPAPELGAEAVFIESDFQPHVVFVMGGLIIDVDAEVIDYETGQTAPPRDVMIAYALRVRELLAEANS